MGKLDMLLDIAAENEIAIEYVDFNNNILGMYYKEDGLPPIIGINENIISNTRLFTCVLAEELGHHFTTVNDLTAEYYSYSDKLIVNKYETLALKWATEILLPLDEIITAVKSSFIGIEDLSEQLQVTTPFLLRRFQFIAKYRQIITIDDTRKLILTNLPNVYLFKSVL